MPEALRTTMMYCGQRDRKGEMIFVDFYTHPMSVKMHGHTRLFKVQVTEDPTRDPKNEDGYWGWWDTDTFYPDQMNRFHFVYPHQMLLNMCFAYGPEQEEKRGKGVRLPVKVEMLEEVTE